MKVAAYEFSSFSHTRQQNACLAVRAADGRRVWLLLWQYVPLSVGRNYLTLKNVVLYVALHILSSIKTFLIPATNLYLPFDS